jgi:hypothetical protein
MRCAPWAAVASARTAAIAVNASGRERSSLFCLVDGVVSALVLFERMAQPP